MKKKIAHDFYIAIRKLSDSISASRWLVRGYEQQNAILPNQFIPNYKSRLSATPTAATA